MIIDLSHPICNGMPVYPGTEEALIERPFTIEENGFCEARLKLVTHTGTHMDAPAHMISGGKTLDQFPIHYFFGKAKKISVLNQSSISLPLLKMAIGKDTPEFILIQTGWSEYWGTTAYFRDFPTLTSEAANWLSATNIRGIGFDAISADPVGAEVFSIHEILLGAGLVIIENLKKLDLLPSYLFTFACFPLPLKDADGSPVRAVAMVDE
jgi:arylformamidase